MRFQSIFAFYYRARNKVLERLGRKSRYLYHIVQHGWNAYLRMVDLDYQAKFTCPTCKDNPEVIILDGITLGTLKRIPEIPHKTDENQRFNLIPFSDRVLIPNPGTRKLLKQYCSVGLKEASFTEMINSINNIEFMEYILYSTVVIDGCRQIHDDFPRVNVVINSLSYPSPLSGIFQCSLLTKQERKLLVMLSKGKYLSTNELRPIFAKLNSIKQLFDSLPTRMNNDGQMALHHIIIPLLTVILTKIDYLSKQPTRQLVECDNPSSDYFNYFPAFPINYK